MAANQIILALDEASDLSIDQGAPATLIQCHAEAAAELALHPSDSVFAFEMVELMRGPIGRTPSHQWNGTKLKFENADGSFGSETDLKGEPGAIGGTFEFMQSTAAALWTINHNLGFRPAVKALSVGGVEMLAEVIHTSTNQALVYFDAPTAGIATCS